MQATTPPSIRLLACALLLPLLLTACEAAGPVRAGQTPPEERARQAAERGDHAAAARAWEQAATRGEPPERIAARLAAAREWIAAGDATGAERVLAALKPPLTPGEDLERSRLLAELALLRRDPTRALALLNDAPPATVTPAVLETRARALFAANRVVEATRTMIARERQTTDAAALAAGRRVLTGELRKAARAGADFTPPAGADATLAGWLDLGRTLQTVERNPQRARGELVSFRARHPGHPAGGEPARELLQELAAQGEYPGQVALLLPVSGRMHTLGLAVRDGFMAGYYQQDAGARPRVRVYDTAATDVASAYLAALTDGADFVVGPLTREEVAALAQVADGRVNTLALNHAPDGATTPRRFYQFALPPEDEARAVARRALAEGRSRAVALAPNTEWGRRVVGAFREELERGGGQLVEQQLYLPATTDFQSTIESLLRVTRVPLTPSVPPGGTPPSKPQFAYNLRSDVDFIFMPAQPTQGRLVRPQLKFHHAGALPAYATSDIYEPSESANTDLDGVAFPDMPWMIDEAAESGARGTIQRLWPERARRRGRLFALGFDAYRLVGEIAGARSPFAKPVAGATGLLTLDADRRVRRELDWAQIRGGQPRLLAISEPLSP
ncbi:MAG: penicillin-binding protein activator [Steroidobacteraceae bacterium]